MFFEWRPLGSRANSKSARESRRICTAIECRSMPHANHPRIAETQNHRERETRSVSCFRRLISRRSFQSQAEPITLSEMAQKSFIRTWFQHGLWNALEHFLTRAMDAF